MANEAIGVGDVVQLRPDNAAGWGPLLCIVTHVHADRAVDCYAMIPNQRGNGPEGFISLKVNRGGFALIGPVR